MDRPRLASLDAALAGMALVAWLLSAPAHGAPPNPNDGPVPPSVTESALPEVNPNSADCGIWADISPGNWPPNRQNHAAIYDPVRQEMVVYGGFVLDGATNQAYAQPLAGGFWHNLGDGGSPGRLENHRAVYDPVRDRMIVIGGDVFVNSTTPVVRTNAVWALTLSGTPGWTNLAPTGTAPAPRSSFVAIYDAPRDRIIVFGGNIGAYPNEVRANDVWALDLSSNPPQWTELIPAGTPPAPRVGACAIYDPLRDRMILYGGRTGPGSATSTTETWELTLSGTPAWTQLAAGGSTPARRGLQAVYDPVRDRMLVHGIDIPSFPNFPANRLQQLALSQPLTWIELETFSTPGTNAGNTVIWDAPRERLVLFYGGEGSQTAKSYGLHHNDPPVRVSANPSFGGSVARSPNNPCFEPGSNVTFTATPRNADWGFTGWSGDASGTQNPLTLTVSGPRNVIANFVTYNCNLSSNPSHAGTVTRNPQQGSYAPGSVVQLTATATALGWEFTGWSGDASGTDNPLTVVMDGVKNIVANFEQPPPSCGGWYQITVGSGPGFHDGARAAYDPPRNRMLVFGGEYSASASDLHELSLSGTPAWTTLSPGGSKPSLRRQPAVIYDPVRDRLLVVGGTTSSGPLNDVYELPLSGTFAWSAVTPVGTPPAAVSDPSVIYDPVRDRLLWFGGYWSSTGVKNDVWQLSLAPPMTWSQVATSGTPPEGRWQHVAIYDPVRDRMVVVGGTRATPANVFQDVWALSLGGTPTWTELETVGPPHPTPARPGAAYDPVRDRIVFTGGNATYSNRLSFVLSLKHGAVWSQLTPHGAVPEARANMASIYDPVNQQFIIFAGKLNDLGPWYDDTFALQMANGYALELTSDPPDGGSIEKEDTRSCYSPNEMVTLTATPSSGFQFMRWRGDATGSTNPLTVEMSEHQEIVAEFVPENVSVSPGLARFELGRVFPSPAATAVQIEYSLGFESDIDLSVFDVAGRQVATLETGIRPAGTHRVRWDGATSRGSARVGLYFVRYRTAQGVWQKPVVLVR